MALLLTELTKTRLNTFYKKYPSLKFDDMINKMLDNTQLIIDNLDINNINKSLTSKIFDKIDIIEMQIGQITDTISNQLITYMLNFKNEFKNEISMIMNNNTVENIIPLLQKYNEELYNKTLDGFNTIIPKNNESLSNNISTFLKELYESINQDTLRLTQQSINQNTLNDFISTIDNKFSNSITVLQQNLSSNINFTESRLNTQINNVKELTIVNKETENQILTCINKHFGKLENSSVKGAFSESMLNAVLVDLFETAEIIDVSKETHRGDIIMNRNNKPKILFENKFHNENVPTHEVNKFIADVLRENCSGIFVSQKSGICLKGNFEIDIDKNNNVLVYLTKVNYNPDIIKIAVNIVDYLKGIVDKIYINCPFDSRNINKYDIESINNEFIAFFEKKTNIINSINSLKKTIDVIVKSFEDITFPVIENLFIDKSKNVFTNKKKFVCVCSNEFDSQRGLNQHKAKCNTSLIHEMNLKKQSKSIPENVIVINIDDNDNTNKDDDNNNKQIDTDTDIHSVNSSISQSCCDSTTSKERKKYTVKISDTELVCQLCDGKFKTFNTKSLTIHKNDCIKKMELKKKISIDDKTITPPSITTITPIITPVKIPTKTPMKTK